MACVQITPQKRKVASLVFVPLLAQEPSNLGPKEAELPLRLTFKQSHIISEFYLLNEIVEKFMKSRYLKMNNRG